MDIYSMKKLPYILILFSLAFILFGCQESGDTGAKIGKPEELNTTIGEIVDIYQSGAIQVRGFGIVAGLNGTGSRECPPKLMKQLIKFIQIQMVDRKSIDPRAFIESKNTAVVEVYGVIPALAGKGDLFDLRIAPLAETQTTSLEGGSLFTTKLAAMERFFQFDRYSKTLAMGNGPVFINKLQDKNPEQVGDYVLAGGKVSEDVQITMLLHSPNFFTAGKIRNSLNERFGKDTVKAKSPLEIDINIPPKYQNEKHKFMAMIRAMYLGTDPEIKQSRIDSHIRDMINNADKLTPEIALETVGNSALNELEELLGHPNEQVRLYAARCMLNIGDDGALETLRKIINNKKSPYRIEAVKAVGNGAKRKDALPILYEGLDDKDFDVALEVYDQLQELGDISISRTVVSHDFVLDSVLSRGPKRIYVTRQSIPKIVIFGEPVYCEKNLFVQANDGDIILNARKGDKYISISRKHPSRPEMIGPLHSTFKVKDVVRTLGESPEVDKRATRKQGLAVSYSDIIATLEKMCRTGVIDAEFIAGDTPYFIDAPKPIQEFDKPKKETNGNQRQLPKKRNLNELFNDGRKGEQS